MSKPRDSIVVMPLPVKQLGKLSPALNRAVADGYAIQDSCFVPTTDGGLIVYVLADVREPDELEGEPDGEDAEPATNGNGSAELAEPQILGAENS